MAKADPAVKEAPVAAPEVAPEVAPEPVEAVLPFEVPKGAQVEDLGGGTYCVKA